MEASAPTVLAKIGEGGFYARVQLTGLLAMDRGELLLAFKGHVLFASELAGVVHLNKCAVFVCTSASASKPAAAELAAGAVLEGALTLGAVIADLRAPAADERSGLIYVYIDVLPPPPAAQVASRRPAPGDALSDSGENAATGAA